MEIFVATGRGKCSAFHETSHHASRVTYVTQSCTTDTSTLRITVIDDTLWHSSYHPFEILNVQFNLQYLHAAQMNFISDVSFSNFVIYPPFLGVWLSSALSNHCFLFQITQLTRIVHHQRPGTLTSGSSNER